MKSQLQDKDYQLNKLLVKQREVLYFPFIWVRHSQIFVNQDEGQRMAKNEI